MADFLSTLLGPFDPSRGSRSASAGASQAQGQYQDLANQQKDWFTQGMNQANSYFQQPYAYGQTFAQRGPGAMENAYGSLAGQLGGGGQSGNAYGYVQGQLQGPSASQDYWSGMQGQLQQPTSTSSVYGQFRMPGALSGAYNQTKGYFQQPTATSGAAGAYASTLNGPGQLEQFFQSDANRYNAPTSTANLYQNNFGGYGNDSQWETAAADRYLKEGWAKDEAQARQMAQRASLDRASATERAAPELQGLYREAGGLGRTANQAEQYAARQLPGMERQGLGEQFFSSAMQGNNPYLQRIEDQNMARLNQEMARRGHFDSGGANAAIGNLLAASGAEKFKALNEMATGAQQLGMQRTQLGQGLAQSSDTGRLARGQAIQSSGGSLQGLAGQSEGERMARKAMQNNLDQSQLAEANADRAFELQRSQAADQTRLARLAGMAGLAGQNDQQNLAQLNALAGLAGNAQAAGLNRAGMGLNFAGQQDTQGLGRVMAGLNAGSMADQGYLAGMNQYGQLAGQNDQTSLARILAGLQGAGQADSSGLARLGALMNSAGQADQVQLARALGIGSLANNAQDAENARLGQNLAAMMGPAAALSGNTMAGYGAAGNAYGNYMDQSINAQMTAALMKAQGQAAQQQFLMQALQMGAGMPGSPFSSAGGGGGGYGGNPYAYYQPPRQGPTPSQANLPDYMAPKGWT